MKIEIGAPCSLPLGLVQLEQGGAVKTCLLGITLQHPPVVLAARPAAALSVTGARADVAYAYAARLQPPHAEIEIELAIPSAMGLGSEAMLGLSVAGALAGLNQSTAGDTRALAQAIGLGPQHALEFWGYDRGGLLLVDPSASIETGSAPLRRQEIAHPENEAWAFVLHLPHKPPEASPSLEADRLAQWIGAAPFVSPDTGTIFSQQLWPALEADDLPAFASALMAIRQLNGQAAHQAGVPAVSSPEAQAVLDLMRDNGALAWGESATGLARFGLIRGALASIALRKKLTEHVGYEGGTVMAAICDNRGAQQKSETAA